MSDLATSVFSTSSIGCFRPADEIRRKRRYNKHKPSKKSRMNKVARQQMYEDYLKQFEHFCPKANGKVVRNALLKATKQKSLEYEAAARKQVILWRFEHYGELGKEEPTVFSFLNAHSMPYFYYKRIKA